MQKIVVFIGILLLVSTSLLLGQAKSPLAYIESQYNDGDSTFVGSVNGEAEFDTVRVTDLTMGGVHTAPPFNATYIGFLNIPALNLIAIRPDVGTMSPAGDIGDSIEVFIRATHPTSGIKYEGSGVFKIEDISSVYEFPPYNTVYTVLGDGLTLQPVSSDPDTVIVVGTSLTPTSGVGPGTDDVPMLKLTLSTDANDAQWTAVKVDNRCVSYTTYASDIETVKVYKDNGDGTFDPTTDTLIGQNTVTDDGLGGTSTITFSTAETITTTAGIYFIVYDIASTADPAHCCGAKLTDNSYITVDSPDVVAPVNFPIQADPCQCLPVELAAFTATYVADYGYISLSWVTASETDVQGFNIHRNTEDDLSTSDKLNASLIAGHGTSSELHKYEFTDENSVNFGTTYYYWLETVDLGGTVTTYGSYKCTPEEGPGGFIDDFQETVLSNYPNPFTGSTTIKYGIKGMLKAEPVEMSIYNIAGQLVDLIEARDGIIQWDARDFAAGIYFCRIKTENYSAVKKMMILK